jgi:hypothetical protein
MAAAVVVGPAMTPEIASDKLVEPLTILEAAMFSYCLWNYAATGMPGANLIP